MSCVRKLTDHSLKKELRPHGQPGQLPIVALATLLIELKAQIL
jgi:hypothetical protein